MEQELIWYYIKDGQKVGPISLEDVHQLMQRRQLSASDLVWKNGLENWMPIKEIPELSPLDKTTVAPNISAEPRQRAPRTPMSLDTGPFALLTAPLQMMRPFMQPLLLIGVLMVLMGKGCDGLSMRYVQRLQALESKQMADFDNKWERRMNNKQADIEALEDEEDRTAPQTERLSEFREELIELADERDEARDKLVRGDWFDTQAAAQTAMANHRAWGIAREALFIFGTMLLTVALLIAGFSETGPARWVCLIILAIIIFSIYVGGASWISSITGSLDL